ncbi:porin [uncultured Thiodictyon sp.]|uniref:porin n=1 Tax=uncultured Thiodictyon sp. TaxID=1846217 RepID=UPI0025DEBAD3|nr:porin [uncultured Thiodictyon sp.]
MNKKLLTLAVATALTVPAFTASAEAILYGKVNVSIDYINVSQNATYFRPGNTVGPQFNAAPFFYGSGQVTAPNALALANQQTALSNALGAVPGGATYIPGGAGGTIPGYFYPTNAALGWSVAAQNVLTTQYQSTYNAYYNQAMANGQGAVAATTLATGAAAAYLGPNQLAPGVAPTATQQANWAAANKAGWQTAVGGGGGAMALNTYVQGQVNALNNALKAGTLTAADAAAANSQIMMLVGQNRSSGLAGIALQAMALNNTRAGQSFNGWGMDTANAVNGPASRVGVKGSEDLGNGLKAIYQIEIGVDLTNANRDYNLTNGNRGTTAGAAANINGATSTSAAGFSFRNTFVGLAGDWGTFLVGRHDTPMKLSTARLDLFADTLADMNTTIGFQDLRADNTVAYISPNFSGFQLAMAMVPQNASTPILLNGMPDNRANNLAGAYSLAATYKNGPFYGSVAYELLGRSNFAADNPYYQFVFQNRTAKDDSKVRLGAGLLDWNGFTLTGIYEARNNINGAPNKSNANYLQFQAGYAFGNNMVKAMWGTAQLQQCADPNAVGFRFTCQAGNVGQYLAGTGSPLYNNKQKTAWAIGYDYNFSKRTQAYALYTALDDKIAKAGWSGFSIGMMHSF